MIAILILMIKKSRVYGNEVGAEGVDPSSDSCRFLMVGVNYKKFIGRYFYSIDVALLLITSILIITLRSIAYAQVFTVTAMVLAKLIVVCTNPFDNKFMLIN
jgi:hypothetical protein